MSVEPALADLLDVMRGADPNDADMTKACCAAAYGSDVVTALLGDSYHPGGIELSRHLGRTLEISPGDRVLDVASGIGTTSMLLADEFGARVLGVDLGEAQLARARSCAIELGMTDRVTFRVGDAEQLPVDDDSVDVVVCECALCTFPDKVAAATEIARVVRPGGVVGITDVWLESDRLEPELSGLSGRVACLADARPIDEVVSIVEQAGLTVTTVERHDDALVAIIERVVGRLRMFRMLDRPGLGGIDIGRGIELAQRARAVVARGDAGYLLLTAHKPA